MISALGTSARTISRIAPQYRIWSEPRTCTYRGHSRSATEIRRIPTDLFCLHQPSLRIRPSSVTECEIYSRTRFQSTNIHPASGIPQHRSSPNRITSTPPCPEGRLTENQSLNQPPIPDSVQTPRTHRSAHSRSATEIRRISTIPNHHSLSTHAPHIPF